MQRISMVKLTVLDLQEPIVAKAAELLASRWKERTRVPLRTGDARGKAPAWELWLGTVNQPELRAAVEAAGVSVPQPAQSYAIVTEGRRVIVCGADGRGVLYGVGQLLRTLDFAPTRVSRPDLRETQTPAAYNRGMYFATHFNNYYEAAPVERVERYLEEMALWGFDLWMFWFDMNWFPAGFWRDPNSRGMRMINRIRRFRTTAQACGMRVFSAGLGNEGFSYQPAPELRADSSARHGGFYLYSQICPSQPGGLELILANRRKVLELLGPLDGYIHWPYDQGGCGCPQCTHAPGRWGRKFLELGPQIAAVARQANPDIQFIVSVWLMDETERKLVYAQADSGADWFQGIITHAEHIEEYTPPAQYMRLVFPEISMFDCYFCSYGCNGANPAPQRMAAEAARVGRAGWGTTLYSEGMYTDLNAAVYASRLWDPNCAADRILTDYSRYYFGTPNVATATQLIRGLETTWGAKALLQAKAKTVAGLVAKARRLKLRLPRHRDAVDRWRMLQDRAEMDQWMKAVGPERPLVVETRSLYDGLGYLPVPELRRRLQALVGTLRTRKKLVDRLMAVHWGYLEYFHTEKTVMVFLPDEVLGRHQWETLIDPLAKALAERAEEPLRRAASRAMKRWFWSNSIDVNFLFG